MTVKQPVASWPPRQGRVNEQASKTDANSTGPSEMVRVAFRIDASEQAGGGHAMRSLSLLEALARRNVQTQIFVGADALRAVPMLAGYEPTVLRDPYRMFASALA